MIYWPLSSLAHSPLMPGAYALELRNPQSGDRISQNAANACFDVACNMQSLDIPAATIVENTGCGRYHYIFTDYPNFDEWMRLERGGLTVRPDGTPILMFTPLN